jgi:phosphomannomutase/phosphoglucomutase
MNTFRTQGELNFNFDETLEAAKISPFGFREYDARWLYPQEINKKGLELFGFGLGKFIVDKKGAGASIVVGHDYRSYSEEVKYHITKGLLTAGMNVTDIGLSLSPMVYFAQHYLNTDSLAMITASHNENGWTGIKCGIEKSLTFGPDEIQNIKNIINKNLSAEIKMNGKYNFIKNLKSDYIDYLVGSNKLDKKLKIVVACGNGTAGIFAPEALSRLGCEIIELHCNLDFSFPNYNPNPEDMIMLKDLSKTVKKNGADLGFAFDGDGDRLGVVDNEGEEIFSDKVGLMLAEDLSHSHPNSKFVIDVKSTGLFFNNKILQKNNCSIDMWKTGHSHMKRRVKEISALCGFEKSGHFFINKPLGLGFDDGLKSAILMLDYLNKSYPKKLSELKNTIQKTYQSPTMAPFCEDGEKYIVIELVTDEIEKLKNNNSMIANQKIESINTINGVRFHLENGSWGLIRASSNKPSLVVVIESFISNDEVKLIFSSINEILNKTEKVGEYDQELPY